MGMSSGDGLSEVRRSFRSAMDVTWGTAFLWASDLLLNSRHEDCGAHMPGPSGLTETRSGPAKKKAKKRKETKPDPKPGEENSAPPVKKRRGRKTYTNGFKLEVADFAKTFGVHGAAKHFNVDRATVRDWKRAEETLRLAVAALEAAQRAPSLPGLPSGMCLANVVNGSCATAETGSNGEVLPRPVPKCYTPPPDDPDDNLSKEVKPETIKKDSSDAAIVEEDHPNEPRSAPPLPVFDRGRVKDEASPSEGYCSIARSSSSDGHLKDQQSPSEGREGTVAEDTVAESAVSGESFSAPENCRKSPEAESSKSSGCGCHQNIKEEEPDLGYDRSGEEEHEEESSTTTTTKEAAKGDPTTAATDESESANNKYVSEGARTPGSDRWSEEEIDVVETSSTNGKLSEDRQNPGTSVLEVSTPNSSLQCGERVS